MRLLFKIIKYNSPEYQKTLQLRDEVMRKPLGLKLSEDDVKYDDKRIHIAGYLGDELVCGCSLRVIHQKMVHIYSVFVKQNFQKKNQGIGKQLMAFAEHYAIILIFVGLIIFLNTTNWECPVYRFWAS